ncbi:MAG: hypothetical protein IKL03_06005 [Bacteroidaceae bacterium]|nr:hypothetical protein [Bacteroidaceae bacterium]
MKKLNIKVLSLFVAAVGIFAGCSQEEITKADIDAQNAVAATELPTITALSVDTVGAFDAIVNVTIKGNYEHILELNLEYADNETLEGAKAVRVTTPDLLAQIPEDVEVNKEEGYTFKVAVTGLSQNSDYYLAANAYVRGNAPIICEDVLQITTMNVYVPYVNGVYSCGLFGEAWEQPMEKYILQENVYRLPDYIATGYDLLFTWNPETGEAAAINETWETGYVHSSYGMINATCDGITYDAETKTFTFAVEYTCAAGSFGGFNDTFVVAE